MYLAENPVDESISAQVEQEHIEQGLINNDSESDTQSDNSDAVYDLESASDYEEADFDTEIEMVESMSYQVSDVDSSTSVSQDYSEV